MRVLVFAAALYLLVPGHPDIALSGVPLGQTGAFLLIIVLLCWAWTRDVPATVRPSIGRGLGVLIAVKLALALFVPHSGWLASYYANDVLRRSVDFAPSLGATRIDRQLSFVDTEFPVHFFNEHGFNYGLRREATEPWVADWKGFVHAGDRLDVRHDAKGALQIVVDGVPAAGNPVAIEPGDHVVEIRYVKDKEVEGAVHVAPIGADGAPRPWALGEVTPVPTSPARRTVARIMAPVAWIIHAMAALLVLAGFTPAIAAKLRQIRSLGWIDAAHQLVMPAVILFLTAQGLWKSRHLVGHVFTLTGGDDWLAFEMNARDILINGPLLLRGSVPGKGLPYFEYPGYGYFVAAGHWLTGESLAGIILLNFVCLALATTLSYAIARRLTNPLAALCGVALLLFVQQLAFVRYYTVTLLSENLYFLLVPLMVYWLVRYLHEQSWWTLIAAAIAGGLATATRPTMQLFLPVAIVILAFSQWRAGRLKAALVAPVVFVVFFFAAIGPFTYRNYVMSGKPVLVTEGQAQTFIDYNLPEGVPTDKYLLAFHGSNLSAAKVLLMILWDEPAQTLKGWATKAVFGLGMVHWMGAANRPHPELLLTSVLYLAALLLVREARTAEAWIIHGFIATHLATLLLTSPANYGYRMVLTMYLLMAVFAGAVIAKLAARWVDRGVTHPSPA
jgi:hypothetical protein